MQPSIIGLILSYNGKHLLEEAIPSYLDNDYSNFEVVVIDNGSTDGTKEWVNKNYPEVEVLRTEKNLGYAGGFNFGMEAAFNQRN
ncbi:MAG: glycosyltransferase family 2 protein, partial [Bacteroidota bacterium]